ncbi:hypothetical protein [Acetobacterium sp.]|uniref:hypothetical protein n=1 Tax=Acetobacterium sp. TaxID=1872094 RepID=UPI00271BCCDF|nr:hypothetical protein [Acetobacterium sp.]MDO9491264.1 hypothetical protein [Acetobacterium sp.]
MNKKADQDNVDTIVAQQLSFDSLNVKSLIDEIISEASNENIQNVKNIKNEKLVDIYSKINDLVEELVIEYGIDPQNINVEDINNEVTKLALVEIIGNKNLIQTSKVSKQQGLASQKGQFGISFSVGGAGVNAATVEMKMELKSDEKIEYYDTVVQDAIGTLMDQNGGSNVSISPAQIYRKMAGLEPGEKVSQNCEKEIIESVDKMRWTRAWIDFKEQAGKHKSLSIGFEEATLEGALVQADKLTAKIGGHQKMVYYFYRPPLSYIYSQRVNQIATVESKLLETSGVGQKDVGSKTRRNTKEFICLKHFLAKEIEFMKYQKNKGQPYESRRKYETIFQTIGAENITDKQMRRLREDVDFILSLWVEREYIKEYEVYKKGRAYTGVKICL